MNRHRLLVANRSEIAVRIIRAASQLGIETVAVFEPADRKSQHCRIATLAIELPEGGYLDARSIVDIAVQTRSTSIHPGYGFLAENGAFADSVLNAGLIFVGPSAKAIQAMGDKISARARMKAANVPIVPGIESIDVNRADITALQSELDTIGYPVMVKASAGGGGKGMRVVNEWDSFLSLAQSAQGEAARSFANDTIYVEKYISEPKHIEVQIFGSDDAVYHLGERECSIQRRHQKVIEECPSPSLSKSEREAICQDAISAAAAIDYRNAGTIEFLFDSNTRKHYFLEMNTRLQVEHPITEWCTGIDLVRLQILQAIGRFPPDFAKPACRGHAIECRIYAEDPESFIPAPGHILSSVFPSGPGVRVDTAIEGSAVISSQYDPQIAKISCWGNTRLESIQRMRQALAETRLVGLTHNISFLQRCLRNPIFLSGDYDTSFVSTAFAKENSASNIANKHAASGDIAIQDQAAIAFALSRMGLINAGS